MNKLFAILLLVTGNLAIGSGFDYRKFVNDTNRNNSIPWNASINFINEVQSSGASVNKFAGTSASNAESNPHFQRYKNQVNSNDYSRLLQSTAPLNLDLRVKYPFCYSLSNVRNQAGCGSCWAVSSMASLSDRYCIMNTNTTTNVSGKAVQKTFSYEDTLECCTNVMCGTGGNGCNGGYLNGGYAFAFSVGVSTGDAYQNTTSGCKPYFLSPAGSAISPPTCRTTCANPTIYKTPYSSDKTKIKSYKYIVGGTVTATMGLMINELNTFGSIIAFMYVYADLFSYKTGIYTYQSGALIGGHAIRIIGYGTSNGVDYWLVANSWGTGWGESGYFRIKRGVNMCSIEALPVAAYF
jgi:cathepsin B